MLRFVVSALALSVPLAAIAAPKADPVAAALASPSRPAADKARDANRKPAELVRFAKVKPGDTVLDFAMGGGYLTRVLAGVVGPRGRVIAYQPAEFIAFRAAYGTEQDAVAKDHANVTPIRPSMTVFELPAQPDVIITVQNYHDMHLKMAPADGALRMNKALFHALKPGGVLVVVDHVAKPGDVVANADNLHRIDPAVARQEIEAAGFVFDGESTAWANPVDDYTKLVFNPAVRGKTDQFAYRFRKPK
jgi:predicted methyltransferase